MKKPWIEMPKKKDTTEKFVSSNGKFTITVYGKTDEAELYANKLCHLDELADAVADIKLRIHNPIKCYVTFYGDRSKQYIFYFSKSTVSQILAQIIQQLNY